MSDWGTIKSRFYERQDQLLKKQRFWKIMVSSFERNGNYLFANTDSHVKSLQCVQHVNTRNLNHAFRTFILETKSWRFLFGNTGISPSGKRQLVFLPPHFKMGIGDWEFLVGDWEFLVGDWGFKTKFLRPTHFVWV